MKLRKGIIQFYLKKRQFGYVRIPNTGEEFHFKKENLKQIVEDKDEVTFEVKGKKNDFYADNIEIV